MKTLLSILLLFTFSGCISKPERYLGTKIQGYVQPLMGGGVFIGSGFFVSPKKLITNKHVCFGRQSLTVVMHGGNKTGEVFLSKDEDLCLIKFKTRVTTVYLKISKKVPKIGQMVLVLGYPDGVFQVTSNSVIGRIREHRLCDFGPCINYKNSMYGKFRAYGGSSGGPVLDNKDNVVGIVYAIDNIYTYFIPQASIIKFLEKTK